MDWQFFAEILAPLLLGLAVQCYKRLAGGARPMEPFLFLAAQLWLIHVCGFGTFAALSFVLVILGGYAVCACKTSVSGRPLPYGLAALFIAYLGYWALEKYAVPLCSGGPFAASRSWAESFAAHVSPLAVVGISYMGFKLVHFHVDRNAGAIEKPNAIEVVNWLLFFPSIVAGPMQRFQDWQRQRAQSPAGLDDFVRGAEELLLGLFMKFALANGIRGFSLAALGPGPISIASPRQLAVAALIYPAYLYFDFAGYSNIAIGTGRFWGISLPENFRYPYVSRNLAEFWNRWHISLSQLLRDYLYYPISLALKRRAFFRSHTNFAAALPLILTFVTVGFWHGLTVGYIVYGFIHGVGLGYIAITRRWKSESAFSRWWHSSKLGYLCAVLINYGYVAVSFCFFALSDADLLILYQRWRHILPPIVR